MPSTPARLYSLTMSEPEVGPNISAALRVLSARPYRHTYLREQNDVGTHWSVCPTVFIGDSTKHL